MSGERSSDPNDPDYVPSVFAHTTPKEKEDNFERYRCYKRRHESVNASNNSLDKGPGSSKHMVFNNFEQVHETMSDQKIVLQNVQLTYKPALQSHHQQSASPAHYATPAQVTRPAVVVLPQQQNTRPPANLLPSSMSYQSKYGELLNVIEDLGREIKPTYAGSKMAQERLKKGIMHARALVRECLAEVEKSARQ